MTTSPTNYLPLDCVMSNATKISIDRGSDQAVGFFLGGKTSSFVAIELNHRSEPSRGAAPSM